MVPVGEIDNLGSFIVTNLVGALDHSSMNIRWLFRA